ncbi:MAG: YDG domain-containing protein [Prevotella sp.]|nr:YDG domain-containing protein [Prevotella sp.]
MSTKENTTAKTRIICALALCLLVGVFGVIALLSIFPMKTSATNSGDPLYVITVANQADLQSQWNAALNDGQRNVKITLTNNIDVAMVDGQSSFGTGDGFQAGCLYVPQNCRLEIDLNGYRLNKGAMLSDNGSVILNDGTLTITDSNTGNQRHSFVIKGQTYYVNGGAIMGGYTLGNGGGIYNNGTLNVNGGNIVNCSAEGSGGGIYATTGATVNIAGGTFSYNFANGTDETDGGGAVAVLERGSLTLTNANFINNQANNYGGAIFAAENTTLNITTLRLTGNQAVYGGGLASAGNGSIATATVMNNTANLSGGGICVFGGELSIDQGTFTGNSAQQATANGEGDGGGAVAVRGGTLTMHAERNGTTSNLMFTGNTARFGGALANNGGTLHVTGAVIRDNTVNHPSVDALGAGVANLGATSSTYTDCYFTGGVAKTLGRAFFVSNGHLNIDGGLVENHNSENGTAVAALYCATGNRADGVLNFTGGVVLQYNTILVDCWNRHGCTLEFNGATVQYCGYASKTEYDNQSGWAPVYIVGTTSDRLFIYHINNINAHHNRAQWGFIRSQEGGANETVGTPDGKDEDVIFANNQCGIFTGHFNNFTGIIYHGIFENNTQTSAEIHGSIIANNSYGSGIPQIHGGIFRGNTSTTGSGAVISILKNNSDNSGVPGILITGGTFENNTGAAGVIYGSGQITITGGTFQNNHGTGAAGVLYAYYTDTYWSYDRFVNIAGGTFTGNTSVNLPGAVYVNDSRIKTTITGGTFTNNYDNNQSTGQHSDGGGLYIRGELNLGGDVVIKDNTAGSQKVTSNLNCDSLITVIGELTGTVHMAKRGQITTGYSTYNTQLPKNVFVSDWGDTIARIDGEAVAVQSGSNTDQYAMTPTAIAATPTYNATAQPIIEGYVSEKMEVVSIVHTWFDATNQATLSSNKETYSNLAKYINATRGTIIVTDAGQYEVTFRLKSPYVWLQNGGSTSSSNVTITVTVNKFIREYLVDYYPNYGYTGQQLSAILTFKPDINDEDSHWLKDWTVTRDEQNLYGLTYGKDTTMGVGLSGDGYMATATPIYYDGMGRNYYAPTIKVHFRISQYSRVNIDNDQNIEVRIADAKYDGNQQKPSFTIYYRGVLLGTWTGTAWQENTARPYGPFKIKDVVYTNNIMPSSNDNTPLVTFAVDTSYLQTSSYKVMNFEGTTTRSFTIDGYDVTNGEGTMTGVEIVGEPVIDTTKVYDGTRNVAVDWQGKVRVEGANGKLVLVNIVATYDDANVGKDKVITVRYVFGGTEAYQYSHTYTLSNAVITPLIIHEISGITANKVYDGTTTATLNASQVQYDHFVNGDDLSVTLKDGADMTYAVADVGENKRMNISAADLVLTGNAAGNYKLATDLVVSASGTITPANMTATATSYTGVYDAQAHNTVIPGTVKLIDTATAADRDSIQWQYSLDQEIWEDQIPQITKAANIPVYFRVSADNHKPYEGQVQFALSPLDINSVTVNIRLGQTEVSYDGEEHNLIPYITAQLGDNEVVLKNIDDFRIDYTNSYTGGDYDNGKGDTKNVGTVTLRIIGSGNSFVNTCNQTATFNIVPQIVTYPAADTTYYHYNGAPQTYVIVPDERYQVAGNVQTETGTHDVTITLTDKHNYVWENASTDDLIYQFVMYAADITVNWEWVQDRYYVGKTYTVEQALTAVGSNKLDGTTVTGTISFLTTDGKLTVTDPDNEYYDTPNQIFDYFIDVKFTPDDDSYAPVTATLKVPAKWIAVAFNSNIGVGSANAYSTYLYQDTIIYLDNVTGENKLTRAYYTHVGWTLTPNFDPVSARDMTESAFNRKLDELGVVPLNGETIATEDATYYAVWCYLDYTVSFHTNNPQQYTTLSTDEPMMVEMYWTDASTNQFTTTYNGKVTYDESNRVNVYTFNHGEWMAKKQSMLLNVIQWTEGAGFNFAYWADENDNRVNSVNSLGNLDLYAQWQGAKYVLNFVNGETTLQETSTVTNGQPLSANQLPTVTRAGYNFSGWFIAPSAAEDADNCGDQRIILDETVIWTTGDMTLYAGWTRKKVVLDVAKASGLTIAIKAAEPNEEPKVVNSGEFLAVGSILEITVTAKNGYSFQELILTVEGKTEHYSNSIVNYEIKDYNSDAARIPLTIQGTCVTVTYNITYSHQQDAGVWNFIDDYEPPYQFTIENPVALPTGEMVSRAGYTFVGWFNSADLQGSIIKNTKELNAEELANLTLYPKWSADEQNVVLYKGGKAYSTIVQNTDSEYILADLSNEAGFEDYTFIGWSLQADLGGKLLSANSTYVVQSSNNNLYAVWAFKTGNLTLTADKTGDWYNFGAPVITMTAKYNYTYSNTRNGIKVSYVYYNENDEVVSSNNNILQISNVSESGNYYCVVSITDNGYALPVTITSAEITVNVWQKSIDTNDLVFASMPNQIYTGNALTPTLPSITLEGHELVADTDFTYAYSQNTNANAWAHLTITGQGNFDGTVDKTVFYIDPAAMTASATAYTGIYDGNSHAGIVSKEASLDDAVWTYSIYGEGNTYYSTLPEYKDAGEYIIYYRVEKVNYTTVNGQATVIISPKEIVVTWSSTSFIYRANEQAPTATTQTGIVDETLTVSVQGAAVNAGDYVATAVTTNTNYKLANATINYTIAPKAITVTITTPDYIQRVGDEIEYVSARLNGIEDGDSVTYIATYSDRDSAAVINDKPTAAGNYIVTITIDNPNYNLTGLNTAPFIILAEDQTIENYITIQIADWIYGNEPSNLVYKSAAPLRENDQVEITYYYMDGTDWVEMPSELISSRLIVGQYKVSIYIGAVEWDESYGRTAASAEEEFYVLPRELDLTWGELSHTYDGEKHIPNVTINNLVAGDQCNFTLVTGEDEGINVGKYVATISELTNKNYALPNMVSQEYSINKAALIVKINDQTQVYHAPETTLTVEIFGTIYNQDNDDGSVYTVTRATGDAVGNYRINGSSTNPNYAVTFTSAEERTYGWYQITAQEVTVNWLYERVDYNGEEHTGFAQIIDRYTEEVIELPIAAYQNEKRVVFKNAGIYQLKAIDPAGNYILQDAEIEATITPASLLIQPNDLRVRYGEVLNFTVSITGFVGNDDESVLTGGIISSIYQLNDNIVGNGTYPIFANGYAAANYTIKYNQGTLYVEGIALTVLIKDQSSVYGDSILDPVYEFVDGTLMNPSAVFTIQKASGDSVGEYEIRGSVLNRNFSVTFVTEHGESDTAIYTITPRAITVEISDITSVYASTEKDLTAQVTSNTIIGDDNADGSVYTLVREAGNNVGTYKISGISRNTNYQVNFVSAVDNDRAYGLYQITPKSIIAPDQDMTYYEYNGQEQTYQIANWMYRDFYTLSGSAFNNQTEPTQRNAGTYQLILTLDPNCVWVGVPAGQEQANLVYEFTIHKAPFDPVTVDYTAYENIYDGYEHDAAIINTSDELQYTWLFKTDDSALYSESMPRYQKAGTYTVYFKITSQNYADYEGEFTVTITKAKITVIIGENTVEQSKKAILDNFTVTGLCGDDIASDVIELIYTGEEYDADSAAVGDTFALGAILRNGYEDCYEIESVETNSLVVIEPAMNLVPIIATVGGGIVTLVGGGTTAGIVIRKRKKSMVK